MELVLGIDDNEKYSYEYLRETSIVSCHFSPIPFTRDARTIVTYLKIHWFKKVFEHPFVNFMKDRVDQFGYRGV